MLRQALQRPRLIPAWSLGMSCWGDDCEHAPNRLPCKLLTLAYPYHHSCRSGCEKIDDAPAFFRSDCERPSPGGCPRHWWNALSVNGVRPLLCRPLANSCNHTRGTRFCSHHGARLASRQLLCSTAETEGNLLFCSHFLADSQHVGQSRRPAPAISRKWVWAAMVGARQATQPVPSPAHPLRSSAKLDFAGLLGPVVGWHTHVPYLYP